MKQKTFKFVRLLALAVGLLLLVGLVSKIGLAKVADNLKVIGWYFLAVISISLLANVLHALAWYQTFFSLEKKPKFIRVVLAKFAGETINTITPANFVGGDPFRVYFLRNTTSLTDGAASVVIDRTLYTIAAISIVALGLVAVLFSIASLPSEIKYGLPLLVTVVALFMAFIFFTQRKGLFTLIINVLRRLRVKKTFSEKTLNRFSRLDGRISTFYENNKKGFIVALGCHFIGRFMAVVEVYFVGNIIVGNFGLFPSLVLVALSTLVNLVFTLIPGSLGVMEGAYGGVCYLLGIEPSVGVSIQLIRRIRQIAVTSLGFIIILIFEKNSVDLKQTREIAKEF